MPRARSNPSSKLILGALAGVVALALLTRKGSSAGGSGARPSGPPGSPERTFALRNFVPIVGGDPAFAVPIGTSTAMLNRVGCLIGSVTMAVNYLFSKNLSPLDANEVGKRTKGAFQGANTDPTILGAAMGLDVPYKLQLRTRSGATTDAMRKRIEDTLRKGGVVIIHVDYDSQTTGGDPNGDHFILLLDQQGADPKARESMQASVAALTDAAAKTASAEAKAGLQKEIDRLKAALAIPGGNFICADPAGGKFRALSPIDLTGAGFGKQPYRVVGVLPAFRSGEAPATLV
jgi:hypothetical protein